MNEQTTFKLPKFRNVFLVAGLGSSLLVAYLFYGEFHLNEYLRSVNDNNGYCIIVYKKNLLIFEDETLASRDHSGVIRLFDKQGKTIAQTNINRLHKLDDINWFEDKVVLPGIIEWSLPVRKDD